MRSVISIWFGGEALPPPGRHRFRLGGAARGERVVPGADAVLRSACRAGEGCRFSSVAVPSSTFAMIIVERERHDSASLATSSATLRWCHRLHDSSTPTGGGSSKACELWRGVSRPARAMALVWRSWTVAPARTTSARLVILA